MQNTHWLAISFILAAAALAHGASVDLITLNTSSLNGSEGSIDFQFNPGLAAEGATVQILNFTGATYLAGSQQQFGSANGGPVPAAIVLNNTLADNEDFEDVTFGAGLSFAVVFSGQALTSPNGNAGNLSTFAFSVFTDLAGSMPATAIGADPSSGNVADITVSPEGALEPDAISPNAQISAVPEPGGAWLAVFGLILCGALRPRLG